ncbi:helix-turn-helix transcriptional regulator [Leptothoe sp. EHU-05/26/07-4]
MRYKLTQEGIAKLHSVLKEKHLRIYDLSVRARISESIAYGLFEGTPAKQKTWDIISSILGIDLDDYLEYVGIENNGPIHQSPSFNRAVEELSEATVDDIQSIASAQVKILGFYYKEVLGQAKKSFFLASMASIIGLFFFLSAVVFVISNQPRNKAVIPLVSGALIEVIAGINFYLYGRTTQQLSSFHNRLDRTQRYLLANSICETLEGDAKQKTRSELVKTVSSLSDRGEGISKD